MNAPKPFRPGGPRSRSWKGTPDPYAGRESPSKRYDQGAPWLLWAVVASGVLLAVSLVIGGA
jgi:hypothetical protein